ncbi:MAG: trehalose-6-phosphate synthase [Chlamydiales bacterium]
MVIVSNRLPIVLKKEEDGSITSKPGSGGLVTALAPLLRNRSGLWIGWSGSNNMTEEEVEQGTQDAKEKIGFALSSLVLTSDEIDCFYNGFSNEILWPLFHDFASDCNFDPKYWGFYQRVNEKFADKILDNVSEEDFLWIQDYHLLLVAQELRIKGYTKPISFFLHIPFPSLDIYLKLPWRFQILHALLEYDFIAFQTLRDKKNFMGCVKHLYPKARLEQKKGILRIIREDRETKVAAFPISIDYNEFSGQAQKQEVSEAAWYFHEKLPNQKIVFSTDRLDMSKGIPYRLKAIRHLLEKHPELHRKVSFIQSVVPSRTDVPKYQNLKQTIDRLVGDINSEFSQEDWVPIKYYFKTLNRRELLSCYRTAEVALITPLKDGMNLVAKEYVAANIEENGVLVLSEFAGAAAQLFHDALMVNPFDIEGVSEAIYHALYMPEEERKAHMNRLRRIVKKYDIFWWIHSFMHSAISRDLKDFPLIEEYIPSFDPSKELEASSITLFS